MVNFFRKTHRAGVKLLLPLAIILLASPAPTLEAQMSKKRAEYLEQQEKERQSQKFPDQYSVLDSENSTDVATDEFISSTLESSRQSYLQALILIKREDTVSAARYFQQAIDILNKLVSYPNIDKNEDFTELAQSIVEDYESHITNLESLDENASLFIMRDKLFQEIEKIPATTGPITPAKSDIAKVAYPNMLSNPESLIIPLVDHDLVDRNITFLTKNRRGINFVKQSLERSGKWFPMMKRIAANEGLPEEIIYLSMIESGLNPNAISRASAVGLWQFMRATGQDYKLNEKESYWVDERRDPEKSTLAAMRHLRDLYYEFGDWHLAMAAYNCGTGCVRRAIRRSGLTKPSYWEVMNRLPKETANYVPQYIATARVAMNPELYGFDLSEINFQQEYKYDIFAIDEPTNLTALAAAAGVSLEELKELNPELIQDITPADRKKYFLKIPQNSLETFAMNYRMLTPEEKQPFVYHIVERNENLSVIARKYNISTSDLVEVNNLSGYNAKIKRGDKLRVPVGGRQFENLAANASEPNTNVSSQPNVEDSNVGQIVTHTVQRGETIYSISNRYGIRTTDLRNLNNLSFDDDNLQVGQKIIIAQNRVTNSDVAANNQTKPKETTVRHKVKRGETLSGIANKYGVSVSHITKENNLRNTNIQVGQNLRISSSVAATQSTQPAKQENLAIHTVNRGETLSTIAQQYGVTENQLREWNPDDIRGTVVIAGSRIKVMDNSGSKPAVVKPIPKKSSPVYYTIKSGDTLGSIAQRHGVSISELKRNNRNIRETRLQIGQRIRIK